MLMYFYVHCAFFFLKSYYMTHSPPFLEKVYNGRLVRCLRVKSFLTYFYVGSGTFALDAYYSTHSPPFLGVSGRLVRCLRVKSFLTCFYSM